VRTKITLQTLRGFLYILERGHRHHLLVRSEPGSRVRVLARMNTKERSTVALMCQIQDIQQRSDDLCRFATEEDIRQIIQAWNDQQLSLDAWIDQIKAIGFTEARRLSDAVSLFQNQSQTVAVVQPSSTPALV